MPLPASCKSSLTTPLSESWVEVGKLTGAIRRKLREMKTDPPLPLRWTRICLPKDSQFHFWYLCDGRRRIRFEINLVVGSMICDWVPTFGTVSIFVRTREVNHSTNIWFQEIYATENARPVEQAATNTGDKQQSVRSRTPAAEEHPLSTYRKLESTVGETHTRSADSARSESRLKVYASLIAF